MPEILEQSPDAHDPVIGEYKCLGHDGSGCKSKLRIFRSDLYSTTFTNIDGYIDSYVQFTCPICGESTTMKQSWPFSIPKFAEHKKTVAWRNLVNIVREVVKDDPDKMQHMQEQIIREYMPK